MLGILHSSVPRGQTESLNAFLGEHAQIRVVQKTTMDLHQCVDLIEIAPIKTVDSVIVGRTNDSHHIYRLAKNLDKKCG